MTTEPSKERKLRTLDDVPVDGRRVIVRVDFNVAVNKEGKVSSNEDYRIKSALQTIEELQQRRCKILLLTHRGEPKQNSSDADLTPIHHRLEELLGEEVKRVDQLFGDAVNAVVDGMSQGEIVLLPNVRMDEREELASDQFAQKLAASADVYVNEGFSVCHRPHASVALLPTILPSCAGRRTVIEVNELKKLQGNPAKPYVAIVSGAKISTKIGMLYTLLSKVDKLCVGGQLGNVFLAVTGKHDLGKFNADDLSVARVLLEKYANKILLPVDLVAGAPDGSGEINVVSVDAIPQDVPGLFDIGPASVKLFLDQCRLANTIMWNGPVGRFEVERYAAASIELAKELSTLPSNRVVGGGDTVITLEQNHLTKMFNHVSIGGGAMIAFLEGKRMPGLEPLY